MGHTLCGRGCHDRSIMARHGFGVNSPDGGISRGRGAVRLPEWLAPGSIFASLPERFPILVWKAYSGAPRLLCKAHPRRRGNGTGGAGLAVDVVRLRPTESVSDRAVRAELVFVLPAYNEEENLPRLFEDFEAAAGAASRRASRVLIVDDGSQDGTAELVERYDGPLPVELLRLGQNQGPGAAFRAGFARGARALRRRRLVVTLEADTTSDLDALPAMLERGRRGAELVLASWVMRNVSRLRRFLSARRGWSCAARSASRRTPSRRSSVSTARPSLRAARTTYGDELIGEPGFACKAELLAKLAALGAHDRGGPGRPRLLPARRARARCRSSDDRRLLAAARPRAGSRRQDGRMSTPSVGIVGGGILGMTAAYRLAQAGVHVALYERSHDLGGLVGSFDFDGTPVDRFYHVDPARRTIASSASRRSSASATSCPLPADEASASTTTGGSSR